MTSPETRRWIAVAALAIAFATLATLVTQGLLDQLDDRVRAFARPNDVWGPAQLRADLVIEGLRPPILLVVLSALTVSLATIRRSWQPIVIGLCGLVLTAVLTLGVKLVVGRPDPHGHVAAYSGSFPSGHVIAIVISVGLAVLMIHPDATGWIWFVPAATAGTIMGICLLIQSAHWASDVAGGLLLASCILATLKGGIEHFRLRENERRSLRSPPWHRSTQEVTASGTRGR